MRMRRPAGRTEVELLPRACGGHWIGAAGCVAHLLTSGGRGWERRRDKTRAIRERTSVSVNCWWGTLGHSTTHLVSVMGTHCWLHGGGHLRPSLCTHSNSRGAVSCTPDAHQQASCAAVVLTCDGGVGRWMGECKWCRGGGRVGLSRPFWFTTKQQQSQAHNQRTDYVKHAE